jgi:hypothetical protein
MTNMPPEGFQVHTHEHPQDHSHVNEAIQAGAQHWLAREFVGGMIAMAQTREIDVADFLADRCVLMAMRTATSEAEAEILRAQLQALTGHNAELQRQVDDCPCHDNGNATDNPTQPPGRFVDAVSSSPGTNNGDSSI